MFIFFGGVADKPLREYNATELGLRDVDDGATVELRQNYFHIWFLPFFPLRKFWILREKGQWYPLSAEEVQTVEQRAEIPSTPWQMWAGIVITPIVVLIIIFIIRNRI